MAKRSTPTSMKNAIQAKRRNANLKGYRLVGTASDGTRILSPKHKATHFTQAEMAATIKALRKNSDLEV